ncbi:ABC transporter substrate-binding protein [Streptomyces sp.]|uniref:ABC transporter substrate-binding protein n=1 Tax=Streptomyces sp. TaxID=1931 RepID=UPI002F3F7E1E
MIKRRCAIGVLAGTLASLALAPLAACSAKPAAGHGPVEIPFWSNQAGAGPAETKNMKTMIADFNASQTSYRVTWRTYPFDSYNTTVQSAAAAKKLPCLLAVDQPVVPNWAWAGYLAPLDLPKELTGQLIPGARGEYDGKVYSVGYWDAVLSVMARRSVLKTYGIRVPTLAKPWTGQEFDAALAKIKTGGTYKAPLILGDPSGNGASYPFPPILSSFGGDLIDRGDYQSAKGVLDGPAAQEFGTWIQGLAKRGLISTSTAQGSPFLDGTVAMAWNGNWDATAALAKYGDDMLFLPPPDFGHGIRTAAGSIGFGVTTGCTAEQKRGAQQYLKLTLDPKYIARFSTTQGVVPSTAAAASIAKDYAPGGRLSVLTELTQKHAQVRPATPAFPVIDTVFNKAVGDIIAGADVKSTLSRAASDIDRNISSNHGYRSR